MCKLVHCKRRGSEKSTFLAIFWGLWFSEERLFCKNSTRKPLHVISSPIFTNTPCESSFLCNAPSVHTVDLNSGSCSKEKKRNSLLSFGLFDVLPSEVKRAQFCTFLASLLGFSSPRNLRRWKLEFSVAREGLINSACGIRDGGLSKSEDVWGKRPVSSVLWISQVLFTPSGKERKRQKKGEKGRFWPISRMGGQTPLKPHLLHPHLRQPK